MSPESKHPHLSKSPIVEAVMEVRFLADPDIDLLGRFCDLLEPEGYPQVEKINRLSGHFAVSTQGAMSGANSSLVGYRSRRGRRTASYWIQESRTVFSFSEMAPYTSWEEFGKEGIRVLALFLSVIGERNSTRLALRYINRFAVNWLGGETQQMLADPPRPASGAPADVESVISRSVSRYPDGASVAAVVQSIEKPPPGRTLGTALLDIEVFLEHHGLPNAEIQATLDSLQQKKNDLFFAAITQHAIEEFA